MYKAKEVAIVPPYKKEIQNYTNWLEKHSIPYRILEKNESLRSDDILLLCGGPDFGKNHERDVQEMNWIHQAFDEFIYIVGICRGMQIVNIAMGGTLKNISSDIKHTADELNVSENRIIKEFAYHDVKVYDKEFLTQFESLRHPETIGRNTMEVNSHHHQAIDRLAPILTINAKSKDDIIEAAGTSAIHLVQWHPEREEVFNTVCDEYVSSWIKEKFI